MNERISSIKPESQKSHLIKGIKPIFACLIDPEDDEHHLADYKKGLIDRNYYYKKKDIHDVDYYKTHETEKLNEKNFLNSGINSYVISTVDDLDKFSEYFYNCTGLIVTGMDKETSKNISFISHQDPQRFLKHSDFKTNFTKHLRERLSEIKQRCKEGTIDAAIIGGKYYEETDADGKTEDFRQEYLDSVSFVGREIQSGLGFQPTVINGPKFTGGTKRDKDDIYYNTSERRLYFVRATGVNNMRDVPASDIYKELNK